MIRTKEITLLAGTSDAFDIWEDPTSLSDQFIALIGPLQLPLQAEKASNGSCFSDQLREPKEDSTPYFPSAGKEAESQDCFPFILFHFLPLQVASRPALLSALSFDIS